MVGVVGVETTEAPTVLVREDRVIEEEVRALVRDLLLLDDAGLSVDAGVVGLRGRVESCLQAKAILREISRVPGVVEVRGRVEAWSSI